jgi:hypothetical protein
MSNKTRFLSTQYIENRNFKYIANHHTQYILQGKTIKTKRGKKMKNTTNWHLYKSINSEEIKLENNEPTINNDLLKKIKQIEKVFK